MSTSEPTPGPTSDSTCGRAGPRLWVLLGQIVGYAEFVSRALLPPKVAAEFARRYFAKGVRATVAIEGNTLSEKEVRAHIERKLELPPSKEYLGREVQNVVDAANGIVQRIQRGDAPLVTAEFLADCNGRILAGLSEVLGGRGRARSCPQTLRRSGPLPGSSRRGL